MAIDNPDNIYRYLDLQGRAVEMTAEEGRDVIDALAQAYLGRETYPSPKEKVRVTGRILPQRVWTMG